MTGPYAAEVHLTGDRRAWNGAPDLVLDWDGDELPAGDSLGHRFYRSGGGATALGTTRAATFFVGSLLAPGEEAFIRIVGREPSTGRECAEWTNVGVRRDESGRVLSTLGSKWARERHFVGL